MFDSAKEAFDPATAARVGYTHLIATAKRNPEIASRLQARVARDHPAQYERCLSYRDRRSDTLVGTGSPERDAPGGMG